MQDRWNHSWMEIQRAMPLPPPMRPKKKKKKKKKMPKKKKKKKPMTNLTPRPDCPEAFDSSVPNFLARGESFPQCDLPGGRGRMQTRVTRNVVAAD